MVALAKIGLDAPDWKILPLFAERLTRPDQEIRETSALAMGISQMPESVPNLIALLKDDETGRKLTGRSNVDDRTRTFAAYGLGLVAHATSNTDVKRSAFDALKAILDDDNESSRNIKIGVINAMRLIRPNVQGNEADAKLRQDVIDSLWAYYEKKLGQGEQQIQAHVPPAIATLLGRGGDKTGKFKDAFAGELEEKFGKRANNVYESAALALGTLCEATKADEKYSKALLDYSENGREPQARYFATMALAQIGGEKNRIDLLKKLEKARTIEKPWAAISLGVLAFNTAQAQGANAAVDSTIGSALQRTLNDEKNDDVQAATAVALGLCKFVDAADDIRQLLDKYKKRDELAGYLCIGLALMDDRRSIELIREIVKTSVRRPDLLKQAAIALGKMGDKQAAKDLTDLLTDVQDRNLAKLAAISSALGFIGDHRTIDPLVKMLHDDTLPELSRAFAAVALGGVADKEELPWNSKIAVDLNYRAAVETLTNQVSGILDIL
jgi:HEAT repeat protein